MEHARDEIMYVHEDISVSILAIALSSAEIFVMASGNLGILFSQRSAPSHSVLFTRYTMLL